MGVGACHTCGGDPGEGDVSPERTCGGLGGRIVSPATGRAHRPPANIARCAEGAAAAELVMLGEVPRWPGRSNLQNARTLEPSNLRTLEPLILLTPCLGGVIYLARLV